MRILYIFNYKSKNIEENIKIYAFIVFIANKIMTKLKEKINQILVYSKKL